jgi:hypothetical protein
MKTISKTLLLLAVLCMPLLAQRPEVGFIRIVNAVSPGVGNASFIVNGENLYADGYSLGQTTGGYGIKAGKLEIEVRKQGVKSGSTRVNLGNGETMTVIAFAELQEPKNPDDPPQWAIKLLRLKQQDVERGFGVSMVSVCKEESVGVDFSVEGREEPIRAFAKRLNIAKVDIGGKRAEIVISKDERLLTNISPDSPGNYVVILYDSASGQIEALSYYDPKFVIAG